MVKENLKVLVSFICPHCGENFKINPFAVSNVIQCYSCGKKYEISYERDKLSQALSLIQRVNAQGVIEISFTPEREV